MRLAGSRTYTRPTPTPKMPPGLVELMEGLTKDVLKNNPEHLYEFCAGHMQKLLHIRDGSPPKKHISLEQKIKIAQEKLRQKIRNRLLQQNEVTRHPNETHEKETPKKEDNTESTLETKNLDAGADLNNSLKQPIPREVMTSEVDKERIFQQPNATLVSNIISEEPVEQHTLAVKTEDAAENATMTVAKESSAEIKAEFPIKPETLKTEESKDTIDANESNVIIKDKVSNTPDTDDANVEIDDKNNEIDVNRVISKSQSVESTVDKTKSSIKPEKFNTEESKDAIDANESNVIIKGKVSNTPDTDDAKVEIGDKNNEIEVNRVISESQSVESTVVKIIEFTKDNVADAINNDEALAEIGHLGESQNVTNENTENILENAVNQDSPSDLIIDTIMPGTVVVLGSKDLKGSKNSSVENEAVPVHKPNESLNPDTLILPENTMTTQNNNANNVLGLFTIPIEKGDKLGEIYEKPFPSTDSNTVNEMKIASVQNKVNSVQKPGEAHSDKPVLSEGTSTNNLTQINNDNNANIGKGEKCEIEEKALSTSEYNTISGINSPSVKNKAETVLKPNVTPSDGSSIPESTKMNNSMEINSDNNVDADTKEKNEETEENVFTSTESKTAKGFEGTYVEIVADSVQKKSEVFNSDSILPESIMISEDNSTIEKGEQNSKTNAIYTYATDLDCKTRTQNNLDSDKDAEKTKNEDEEHSDDKLALEKSHLQTKNDEVDSINIENTETKSQSVDEIRDLKREVDTKTSVPDVANLKDSFESSEFRDNMSRVNLDAFNATHQFLEQERYFSSESVVENAITPEKATLLGKNYNTPGDKDEPNEKSEVTGMDLETAAVTIQKVFRTFLFSKSRTSTLEDNVNENSLYDDIDKKDEAEYLMPSGNPNKERRALGISRMDTVLQTVNEEKSLSQSTDDSSLSSAATTIQAHVRGFLVRNKLASYKTTSSSLVNSDGHGSLDGDGHEPKKTILNIHIVPERGQFMSRDESLLTSIDLPLDNSPPSSVNLHPLGYDKSEPRKQLKREDAIQSVSPPSNNSGKLSEEVDSVNSVKDMLNENNEPRQSPISLTNNEQRQEDSESCDTTLTISSTAETVVDAEAYHPRELLSSPEHNSDADLKHREAVANLSSDEMDVVTPFPNVDKTISSPDTDSNEMPKLFHSGEFHDMVVQTQVKRSESSVVREFKNVLVYFLIWDKT